MDTLGSLIPAIVVPAAVCAGLLGLMLRRFAARLPLDRPNARSLHQCAVPRVGGLAVVTGLAVGWLWAPGDTVLLGAAILLAVVSLADDMRPLPIVLRLPAHLAAAAAAALPVFHGGGAAAAIVAVILVTWMINLYNFMDGSDGLAGGMALIGFGCYGLAAAAAAELAIAGMAWSVAASAAAFLAFNFHPARVFLGDCGSIPLGFLAGALGLLGWQAAIWPAWFPPVAFAPFVFDATATLIRRLLRGERVWQAHREHYYQRLVRMGWGHRRTALFGYALMAASAALALALRTADATVQAAGLAALGLVFATLMVLLDRRWLAHQTAARAQP